MAFRDGGFIHVAADGVGSLAVTLQTALGDGLQSQGGLWGAAGASAWALRNGTALPRFGTEYAESWRVQSHESLFTYALTRPYTTINAPTPQPPALCPPSSGPLTGARANDACSRLSLPPALHEACLCTVAATNATAWARAAGAAAMLVACAGSDGGTVLCDPLATACPAACGLRGTCAQGACACDPGFSGPDCGTGAEDGKLQPLDFSPRYPVNPLNFVFWSWAVLLQPPAPPLCCQRGRMLCTEARLADRVVSTCQCSCPAPYEGKHCGNDLVSGEHLASLGSDASTPAASCYQLLLCLRDRTFADGAYWLRPQSAVRSATCDMSTDGGGWTSFFVGVTGSANWFASFGRGLDHSGFGGKVLWRPPPQLGNDTEYLVTCGGAGVRFRLGDSALRYLQSGEGPEAWHVLYRALPVLGTVRNLPTHLLLAADGFVLAQGSVQDRTFAASHRGAGYDYCNSVQTEEWFAFSYR